MKTMKTPLVSVIMSVFNTDPKVFKEALDSILGQSYDNLEILVINDCSEIQYEFIHQYNDSRLVWIENDRNIGLTRSLNKAISICKGKYIARMDSDDISFENRIEKQVDYLERNSKIAILGTRAKEFDGATRLKATIPNKPEYIKAYSLFNCGIVHPTVMMRREFLEENRLTYNEAYRNSQDFDLWSRCMEFGDVVGELPECLLYYRISENQISSISNNSQQKANARKIRENQIKLLGFSPTDTDSDIHNSLSEGILHPGYGFADVKNWCKTIIEVNKKRRYYNPRMLKLAIAQQIFPLIFAKQFSIKDKIRNLFDILTVVDLSIITAVGSKIYRKILEVMVRSYDSKI